MGSPPKEFSVESEHDLWGKGAAGFDAGTLRECKVSRTLPCGDATQAIVYIPTRFGCAKAPKRIAPRLVRIIPVWHAAEERCEDFYDKACGKRTLLLELGVGYNTPTIIRFPFERMVYENENVFLVRVNAQYPDAIPENAKKTLSFAEDIGSVADGLGDVGQSMQGSGKV